MTKCKYWDAGWCYAPDDVETSASAQSACFDYDYCPYLKSQMTDEHVKYEKPMTVVEDIEAQIKLLQSKLEFYKELENHKTPCQEAYKRVYGKYPACIGQVDESWVDFVNGYKSAQQDYKVGEFQESAKNKVSLYDRFVEESEYGRLYYDDAIKIVKEFLMDEAVIEKEDQEYITFTVAKNLIFDLEYENMFYTSCRTTTTKL